MKNIADAAVADIMKLIKRKQDKTNEKIRHMSDEEIKTERAKWRAYKGTGTICFFSHTRSYLLTKLT